MTPPDDRDAYGVTGPLVDLVDAFHAFEDRFLHTGARAEAQVPGTELVLRFMPVLGCTPGHPIGLSIEGPGVGRARLVDAPAHVMLRAARELPNLGHDLVRQRDELAAAAPSVVKLIGRWLDLNGDRACSPTDWGDG